MIQVNGLLKAQKKSKNVQLSDHPVDQYCPKSYYLSTDGI